MNLCRNFSSARNAFQEPETGFGNHLLHRLAGPGHQDGLSQFLGFLVPSPGLLLFCFVLFVCFLFLFFICAKEGCCTHLLADMVGSGFLFIASALTIGEFSFVPGPMGRLSLKCKPNSQNVLSCPGT